MGSGLVFYLLERDDVRVDVLDLCGDGVVVCLVPGDAPCTDLVVEVLQIPGGDPDNIMLVGKYRLTMPSRNSDPIQIAIRRVSEFAVKLWFSVVVPLKGLPPAGIRVSLSGDPWWRKRTTALLRAHFRRLEKGWKKPSGGRERDAGQVIDNQHLLSGSAPVAVFGTATGSLDRHDERWENEERKTPDSCQEHGAESVCVWPPPPGRIAGRSLRSRRILL